MFTTVSIYFLMLFLIFWGYCGYIILLVVFTVLDPENIKNKPDPISSLPKVAIIIPCYNEEGFVKQKIDNLKELNYDNDKFEIYFLNGLSTDNTSNEIAKLIGKMPNWHLLETGCIGKIKQINYGLEKIGNDVDIIVNTDMDTLISPDVLVKFADEFNSNDRIAVVGANISPADCISLERNFWLNQNLMRVLESKVYSSSIVVAPCYAYKRTLIDKFPEDCIADDIFVAFKSNTEGYLTKYVESIIGTELRTPKTSSEFFRHKYRKGNAYLTELFRYFHRLPYMSGWWKVIYLTKILQLAVIPWVLPYFLLSTISLCLSGWGLFQAALFGVLFLSISLIFTSFLITKSRSKFLSNSKYSRGHIIIPFIMSNLILILVGFSYPFYRQTSSYEKIN